MKTLPIAAFVATLIAALLPLSQPVRAGSGIQRCEGADGTAVYTDRACSSLGAKATPISGELLTRIARDEAANPSDNAGEMLAGPATTTLTAAARRSPSAGCARTPTQLSMDLQGSLALHDVNRLAESYHWVGQSHRQAQQLMQQLDRLASKQLLDAHFFDAQIGPGGMQLANAGRGNGNAGVMQLTLGGDGSPQVVDFDVLRYAGCYFIVL
ncbi:hypothetical protein ACFQZQ_08175 [Lysobacter koreensis]|uniref:DUF4124 domain-containing protein n=1 Tax=Lysobacter koreensis TaxID=266122 RepID=A0ABW2YM25_9GAMM